MWGYVSGHACGAHDGSWHKMTRFFLIFMHHIDIDKKGKSLIQLFYLTRCVHVNLFMSAVQNHYKEPHTYVSMEHIKR